ncbi:hypothetical protein JQS43_00135 [Natronosporangium hydrolyticum]|uniref:Sporulation protein n=1 Tax=Natronosporangium hydrolyticum TaxID=2811111 RepID=A0A895YH56_9ACTN|nr:hypothetical protein [Natronosporangium hydrolyticum]QSB14849.1 hypothetical protein JQS43_00135 [Natronosporangium hydrolyticum]
MNLSEVLSTAGDAITVRRVYAEPFEKNGVTIIAGAMVAGGGGGGGGHDEQGQEGEGGGFGVNARPSGAFVIKDGRVSWRPAVDVNQLFAVVGAVAVATLFAWARSRRARRAELLSIFGKAGGRRRGVGHKARRRMASSVAGRRRQHRRKQAAMRARRSALNTRSRS